jgi:hypothetical protein
MCLDSTLLVQLKVVLTKGKNTTEAGSSLCCGGALVGGLRDRESAIHCIHCPRRFAAGILIPAEDSLNHRSPWPCEPGWRVQPACSPDGGESWHSDIGWCELAFCIRHVPSSHQVSCNHLYPGR